MQGDPDRAGVRITTAVGSAWPVRIRLAHFGTFSLHRPRALRRGPTIEKLKILLQRLTCHPHPTPWWRASLLSVAMLLGACSGGGDDAPSIPTPPAAAPPSVALDVAPDTVHETSTADLNWSSTDASECVASGGWSGLKSLTGSESTGALMSTTAYTLTCTGPGGTAGHTVTANVTPANTGAPGPSVSLSVSPPSVNSGGSATLTWSSSYASGCTASGNWSGIKPVSGTASTGPLTSSASFALTCTGGGGAATQTVNVAVNAPGAPPPPSIALSATPSTIASGGTTTLSWTASNVTACTATGGWSGAKAFSGSEARVGLVATTTFALTCSGAGGTASQAVTVNVTPATPPPTVALSAVPNAIVQGASASLTWSSTNATACTASGDWTGAKTTQGTQSTGTLTTARAYSYGLSCTGPGGVASRSATVVVSATPPAPSVSLSANPAQIARGGTSTLSWSATNASTCTASGGWSGAKAISGSQTTSALSQSTTFTLACTGSGGTTTRSVSVTVTPATPPPTVTLTAAPPAIVRGGSSTMNWTTANATSCVASGDWSGSRGLSGSQSTGALNTVRTYNYTLSCSGAGGTTSRTATVVVSAQPPPPTITIAATPSQVPQGGTAMLSWSSANATSCSASGGWSGSKPLSGSQVTAALSQTTTFVLSCSGAGGTASRSTTVTVTVPPAVVAFPLKVSGDQRRLLDQNDRAFLVVGDTPWSLFTGITKAEAEAYLEDRRQRGFNAILVNIVEHFFHGPVNREGQAPFARRNNVYDFAQPNDAYFAHVDYVLNVARSKGLLVLMTPAYLGFQGGQEGWWPEINTAVNTEAVMENYGRYLGNRYRGFGNIVWVMGGDYYADATLAKTRALVRGIQATDQARLFTAHNSRFESGALHYNAEPWFTLNTTYSDCSATPGHLIGDYQRAPTRPFVYAEGRYENENSTTARCLRSQAYWPVLLGAVGSFFGNRPIWLFDPGWQTALDSTGARGMTYYGRLFRSRAWERLVPDAAVLLSGGGAGAGLCGGGAGRGWLQRDRVHTDSEDSDGGHGQGWRHERARLVVRSGHRRGHADRADFATSGSRSFTPPTAQDWVLVLDNAALNLPAPGR